MPGIGDYKAVAQGSFTVVTVFYLIFWWQLCGSVCMAKYHGTIHKNYQKMSAYNVAEN